MIAQTPWIQRSFHFDFPVGNFPVIYSRLQGNIHRLNSMLAHVGDETSGIRMNGWSAKEHLGHLYDLEELWWKRLQDFLQQKEILTAADMQNAKTNEALHNSKTVQQLLDQFTVERTKMLQQIESFDETILSRTSLHPRLQQPMRVIDSLYFVCEHDDHHIAHIDRLIK